MISVVFLLFSLIRTTVAEGSTMMYNEHVLQTNQLCPNPQDLSNVGNIHTTTDYSYKSVFRLGDPTLGTSDLCIFEDEKLAKNQVTEMTTMLIRAIHVDYNKWNYTGSQQCTEFVQLQLSNAKDNGAFPRALCKVSKPSNTLKHIEGPLYHPFLWEISRGKIGFSYSILTGMNESFSKGNNERPLPLPKDFPDGKLPQDQFLQLVFVVYQGESCSLRVQQYAIDPTGKNNCHIITSGTGYTLCGMYNCTEEETILGRVGFWGESLKRQQIPKLIEFFRTNYGEKTSFKEIYVWVVLILLTLSILLFLGYCVFRLNARFKGMCGKKEVNRSEATLLDTQKDVEKTVE